MTETQTRLASGFGALFVVLPILIWGGFWGVSALAFTAAVRPGPWSSQTSNARCSASFSS